jgi:hypothetical protein
VTAPTTYPERPHLSFSAVSEWITCAKSFQLRRVIGLEGDPAYALAGGRAVHAAIEAFERHRAAGASLDVPWHQ